jgi:hypothetical protein
MGKFSLYTKKIIRLSHVISEEVCENVYSQYLFFLIFYLKIDQKFLRESERNICYVVFVLSILGAGRLGVHRLYHVERILYTVHYTVKKGSRVSRLQPGCH